MRRRRDRSPGHRKEQIANLTKVEALMQMAYETKPYTELRPIAPKVGTAAARATRQLCISSSDGTG